MSQMEKVLQSKANSRHFLVDSHDYRGVDGRTYQTETQPVAPQTTIDNEELWRLQQAQNMSLGELYQMELFLTDGTRGKNLSPKPKDKERILAEYPIVKNPQTRTFMGNLDKVWAVLQEKFPETSAPFKSYKACQYAVRYGAIEQIQWKKPDEQEKKAWTPPRKETKPSNEWIPPSQRKIDDSITRKVDNDPKR